ncbi:hypothetical protein LHYA1_G006965, partial [Lachnellula hyalina]
SKQPSSSTIPSLPAYTIYLFGLIAFLAGITPLFSPTSATVSLGLPNSCIPATNGNSLAAIAMGVSYTLAAWQENRTFFFNSWSRCGC